MLKDIILATGLAYASFKAAKQLGTALDTDRHPVTTFAIYTSVGITLSVLAPVTAPVGLALAAHDIYTKLRTRHQAARVLEISHAH